METFSPIEDSHLFYVDHVDGKRQNNNLDNLRWVKATENLLFRNKEWQDLGELVAKLVQKYGYNETKSKLSLILSEKHTLSMEESKKHNNCYIYYEEYIKNGYPKEYDYFELTNEFILSKLLNVDCSINMNIIEHSHKVHSMIDILNRSIILMDIKECARLYNIPNEFIKHHVEARMNPIFEELCECGSIDELVTKIYKININDLKKEIDNNALLG
jgi:hypothetical protein